MFNFFGLGKKTKANAQERPASGKKKASLPISNARRALDRVSGNPAGSPQAQKSRVSAAHTPERVEHLITPAFFSEDEAIKDKMRAGFIQFASTHNLSLDRTNDGQTFVDTATTHAWAAWKEAFIKMRTLGVDPLLQKVEILNEEVRAMSEQLERSRREQAESQQQVVITDLTQIIRKLCSPASGNGQDSPMCEKAMDYLDRHNLLNANG